MAAHHSPMAQFEVHPLIPIHFGGLDLSFTNESLWMVLAVTAASAFLVLGVRRDGIVPGRLQSVVELMYGFIERNTVLNIMGEEGRKFFPFVFSLFMFIFFSNFFGLIPYSFTVTSHIIVTFAMAITVFGRDASSSGSWNQPSSAASRDDVSNRPSGLSVAPRPLAAPP